MNVSKTAYFQSPSPTNNYNPDMQSDENRKVVNHSPIIAAVVAGAFAIIAAAFAAFVFKVALPLTAITLVAGGIITVITYLFMKHRQGSVQPDPIENQNKFGLSVFSQDPSANTKESADIKLKMIVLEIENMQKLFKEKFMPLLGSMSSLGIEVYQEQLKVFEDNFLKACEKCTEGLSENDKTEVINKQTFAKTPHVNQSINLSKSALHDYIMEIRSMTAKCGEAYRNLENNIMVASIYDEQLKLFEDCVLFVCEKCCQGLLHEDKEKTLDPYLLLYPALRGLLRAHQV